MRALFNQTNAIKAKLKIGGQFVLKSFGKFDADYFVSPYKEGEDMYQTIMRALKQAEYILGSAPDSKVEISTLGNGKWELVRSPIFLGTSLNDESSYSEVAENKEVVLYYVRTEYVSSPVFEPAVAAGKRSVALASALGRAGLILKIKQDKLVALVIDSDQAIIDVWQERLKGWGFNVVLTANSTGEAQQIVTEAQALGLITLSQLILIINNSGQEGLAINAPKAVIKSLEPDISEEKLEVLLRECV